MKRPFHSVSVFAVAAIISSLAFWGCQPSGTATGGTKATGGTGTKGSDSHDDHGHDHDHDHGDGKTKAGTKDAHDHDHAHHGPNGGHIIEVGKEEYHLEWTHNDDGLITVYVLDSTMKKEVGVDQTTLTIETKVEDEAATYELAAVKPSDDAKATKFEVTDKALLAVLESLGEKITATIKEIKIGEKSFTDLSIVHDDHDH